METKDQLLERIAELEARLAPAPEREVRLMCGPNYSYWVGYYERIGDMIRLHNATPISWWGTVNGMYELCDGPTPKTRARARAPFIEGHVLEYRTVAVTPLGQENWEKVLNAPK